MEAALCCFRRLPLTEPPYQRRELFLLLFLLRLPPLLFRLEVDRLRELAVDLLRDPPVLFLRPAPLLLRPLLAAFLRRVAAPLRAAAEREALDLEPEALDLDPEAAPPFLPPLREELLVLFFPLPEPLFLPPPSSLFTVAQARRSAWRRELPRFS